MANLPHATVATIVEKNGRFLMVKEKPGDQVVINQPAGHIESGESIIEAAIRETLEETRWQVRPTHFAGISVYHAPNGISYIRNSLVAEATVEFPERDLDTGILEAVWMSYSEILEHKQQLRSPIVLRDIENYLQGKHFPLDLIFEQG